MTTRYVLYLAMLALGGCASNVPVSVKQPPNPDPEFSQVQQNVATFLDQHVRWGGKIISVENKEDSTWIEILASPLNGYGKPSSRKNYEGRFIAKVNGFLDPKQYSEDRKLTIFGTIDTEFFKKIDEYLYGYPLVSTKEYYLWPEYRTAQYRDHYDYPFHYGYPYHHRYHFGFHHRYRHFGYPHYYY